MNPPPDMPGPWPKKGDELFGPNGPRNMDINIPSGTAIYPHIEGYKQAADQIFKRIGDEDRFLGKGFLVLPMVFLYRHFVELSLKDIIALGNYLENDESTYPTNHKLGELWKLARELLVGIGQGCTDEDLDAMEALIGQLDSIDPGSLAFRYPVTKDWRPSLLNTAFNLEQFREGIEKMTSFFEGARMMLSVYKDHKDSISP